MDKLWLGSEGPSPERGGATAMKSSLLTAFVVTSLIVLSATSAVAEFSFADITYWVGSGANQSAMVIDWNDSINPQSLAWGYRWDVTATGHDMMHAIDAADGRLFGEYAYGGTAVYGLGYDVDDDGFTYVPGPNDTGHAGDPDDHYREGWMTAGYWSYWLSTDGASWGFSSTGMDGRALTDGSWDGWSFAPASSGWYGGPPDEPVAATPELSSMALLCLGAIGLAAWRRRGATQT